MRRGQTSVGFTLIELMIVLVVAALLIVIALPGYQDHLRRGKRAEARAALMQASLWLERVATATGVYPAQDSDFPVSLTTVPSGAYRIEFKARNQDGSGYTLSAIPQGAQARDRCGAFTLDESGARNLLDAGASAALTAECWNR
jgi:type IV pilus assembly protein PilE